MPGLAQRNEHQLTNGSSTPTCSLSANRFWSKNSDEVCYNQLQKVLNSSYFNWFFFVLDFGLLLDHCFVLIVVLIVMVWLGLYWILQWEHLFNYFCRFWIYNLSVFLIDKCHSVMVSDISCYLFICCPLNNICHLFELKVNMDDTFLAGAMNYQQWITQTSKWI